MRQILNRLIVFITLVTSPIGCQAAQRRPAAGNAKDVMRKVVATYQSLRSYRDRGTSTSTFGRGAGAPVSRIEFETVFERPGKLRFEWTEELSFLPGKKRNVIWSDGVSAWSSFWSNNNRPEKDENLAMAVAGATGISAGAAHVIPRLLIDEIGGLRIDELEGYSVTGSESVDGVECVHLTGRYRGGTECAVWVGQGDHLIRKIVETSEDGSEKVETRTAIRVNDDIDDAAFTE